MTAGARTAGARTAGARSVGARRLLAVLALLAGLLGMHGLATGHHAAAAPRTVAVQEPAGTHAGGAPAAGHETAGHETAGPTSAGVPAAPGLLAAAPGLPSCPDCAAAAALCLAVLTAVAGALLLQQRARRAVLLPVPGRAVPQPPASGRRPRPPDPVAELCVSRT